MYTGNEKLEYKGKKLPYSMLLFWQTSLSDILLNLNRGTFAEYVVRCALSEGGFDSLKEANGRLVRRMLKSGIMKDFRYEPAEEEKSRLIEFGRYAEENCAKSGRRPETFNFLGFTHYCSKGIWYERDLLQYFGGRQGLRCSLIFIIIHFRISGSPWKNDDRT